VRDLCRRYFHLLIRNGRCGRDKLIRLAEDLADADLFVDLAVVAAKRGQAETAAEAAIRAREVYDKESSSEASDGRHDRVVHPQPQQHPLGSVPTEATRFGASDEEEVNVEEDLPPPPPTPPEARLKRLWEKPEQQQQQPLHAELGIPIVTPTSSSPKLSQADILKRIAPIVAPEATSARLQAAPPPGSSSTLPRSFEEAVMSSPTSSTLPRPFSRPPPMSTFQPAQNLSHTQRQSPEKQEVSEKTP